MYPSYCLQRSLVILSTIQKGTSVLSTLLLDCRLSMNLKKQQIKLTLKTSYPKILSFRNDFRLYNAPDRILGLISNIIGTTAGELSLRKLRPSQIPSLTTWLILCVVVRCYMISVSAKRMFSMCTLKFVLFLKYFMCILAISPKVYMISTFSSIFLQ